MEEINEMPVEQKRPTFLTVICIISWVGCALALIGGVYSYFSAETSLRQMEAMGDIYSGNGLMSGMMDTAQAAYDNRLVTMVLGLISTALCLIGTIMMWNQKKLGYFIYVPAELAPAIGGFVLGAGTWGMVGAGVALILGIVWIVLYGLNLKHMK